MDQALNLDQSNTSQALDQAGQEPDRLYSLLHAHQLAFHRGRYYYCWDSARIYNQYKLLGMLQEYYETLERVRAALISKNRDREQKRRSSIVSRVYS